MSLQENFDKAAAEVKAFSKRPDDSVLLQLYGLYKQATTGDNTTEAPWAIQFEAKAKWDAWNANKGTHLAGRCQAEVHRPCQPAQDRVRLSCGSTLAFARKYNTLSLPRSSAARTVSRSVIVF